MTEGQKVLKKYDEWIQHLIHDKKFDAGAIFPAGGLTLFASDCYSRMVPECVIRRQGIRPLDCSSPLNRAITLTTHASCPLQRSWSPSAPFCAMGEQQLWFGTKILPSTTIPPLTRSPLMRR